MTASPPAAPGMPSEEEIARTIAQADEQNGALPYEARMAMGKHVREALFDQARAILSLIRPAFEAQQAKLAQAVEALEPFAEASSLWENNADDTDLWVRPLSLAERIKARLTVGALRRARSASAAARGETR